MATIGPSAPPLRAPDFALPDHRGGTFRLAEALRGGWLILVFYRGHWCPYCRRYIAKVQHHLPMFKQRGASAAAVSPEPVDASRRLAIDLSLTYPLLSDADGRVIDQYGVRNSFTACRSLLPHPAVFVIDPQGFIMFQSIDRNYKKRTTMRTILKVVETK